MSIVFRIQIYNVPSQKHWSRMQWVKFFLNQILILKKQRFYVNEVFN
jgi:hypothetical protein